MPYKDPNFKKYIPTTDVILEKSDRAFITPWTKREKVRLENKERAKRVGRISRLTGNLVAPRPMKNGAMIDNAFIEKLKRLYLSGKPVKRIAHELNMSSSTITRLVREQEWPKRTNAKGEGERYGHNVNVNVSNEVVKLMRTRIFGLYRTRSDYIRALINRDLGL